jgi:hypothetical protein
MELRNVSNDVGQSAIKFGSLYKNNNVTNRLNGRSTSPLSGYWFEIISKNRVFFLTVFMIFISLLSLIILGVLIKWYLSVEKKKSSQGQDPILSRNFQIDDDDVMSVQSSSLSSILIKF